ncbi:YihY family inner membrane protein [Candidatus Poribacteria bacterium]|nr:YihY family inner membrane protein [Candidatus Poribacteria bacterium]
MSKKKRFPNWASLLPKRGQEKAEQGEKQSLWERVQRLINKIRGFLTEGIWRLDLTNPPPAPPGRGDKLTRLEVFGVRKVKVLIFLYRQFNVDKILTRASALTYSSLLAIVPLFAVIFSILKGFGLHANMGPALSNWFSPLGPGGDEIATKILEFVENSQAGTLGAVGFATLLLTVFGILNNIEVSYNDIWNLRHMRPWLRRIAAYTLLLVVGPISVLLVLAVTAFVTSIGLVREVVTHRVFTPIIEVGLRLFPYVLSCLLFTLSIKFFPNMRVKFKAAIVGGLFSGILWQLSNWGIAQFVVGTSHASARDVLYAGFAALPLFLLWLYIGWVIALLGAELSYVVQHVGVMEWQELEKRYGDTLRRFVMLRAVLGIVRDFATGVEAPSLSELAKEVRTPEPVIRDILEPLVTANILARSIDGGERYLPARDPATVTIELLLAFRRRTTLPEKLYLEDTFGQYVNGLLQQVDASLEEGPTSKLSLREAALAWREDTTIEDC